MSDKAVSVEGLRPVTAVGVVCLRGDELLLVRRGNPPRAGEWSIPGGRIEPGEPAKDAALRELAEEISVEAELLGLIDVVDAIFENKAGDLVTRHYVLIDYVARWVSGEPVAGDDAAEARFFTAAEVMELGLWDETLRIIEAGRIIAMAAKGA
ncbi:MAG: NUDIX hydrolase [Henriciella sp.]|jgi:8-oxo-dGTP diphosphatase